MDGDVLMQAMKARHELRKIPVIMVTADAVSSSLKRAMLRVLDIHLTQGDEARLEGLLSGADDYIAKPFTSKQLVARTHLQMQMGKRKAELEAMFEASTLQLRVISLYSLLSSTRAN